MCCKEHPSYKHVQVIHALVHHSPPGMGFPQRVRVKETTNDDGFIVLFTPWLPTCLYFIIFQHVSVDFTHFSLAMVQLVKWVQVYVTITREVKGAVCKNEIDTAVQFKISVSPATCSSDWTALTLVASLSTSNRNERNGQRKWANWQCVVSQTKTKTIIPARKRTFQRKITGCSSCFSKKRVCELSMFS